MRRALVLPLLLVPALAVAAPPELGLPVDCRIGETCWIIHTLDRDPGPGVRDSFCGPMSYDGHEGIDIGLADLEAMARGVRVLAAAPGRVRGVRDGMEDIPVEQAAGGAAAVEGRECGNGVMLEHEGGWTTQYCHLRRGSVTVAPGEQVERGAVLGLVGNSGLASFPHVHLQVRDGARTVDPFLPDSPADACSTSPGRGLWQEGARAALVYAPVVLASLGLGDGPAEMAAALAGTADDRPLTSRSPALVVHLMGYGFRAGDRIALQLLDPAGQRVFERAVVQDRDQARTLLYGGRKRPESGWQPGEWRLLATLERAGQLYRLERSVRVSQ
jgi:hypothetical protein